MKDNYSWLDSLMGTVFAKIPDHDLNEEFIQWVVDTLTNQIEIEKLRARIDEIDNLLNNSVEHFHKLEAVNKPLLDRIFDLTEKLKELEK